MAEPVNLYATAIAHTGFGCMLIGPSGSGKSRLAADAMMLGAKLVGDDQLVLTEQSGMLVATAAKPTSGVLELHGLGLIKVTDIIPRHVMHLAIELDAAASERLPQPETRVFAGVSIPYLKAAAFPRLTAGSLILYMKAMQEGRILPPDWHPTA